VSLGLSLALKSGLWPVLRLVLVSDHETYATTAHTAILAHAFDKQDSLLSVL